MDKVFITLVNDIRTHLFALVFKTTQGDRKVNVWLFIIFLM